MYIDFDSYSMTNNNDLLNGKVENKSYRYIDMICYLHNGATQSHTHINIHDCAKLKGSLLRDT